MAFHRLAATPDTVRVGVFDAAIPPVLTVASGDTVEIETVNGARRVFPPPGSPFAPTPASATSNRRRRPAALACSPARCCCAAARAWACSNSRC